MSGTEASCCDATASSSLTNFLFSNLNDEGPLLDCNTGQALILHPCTALSGVLQALAKGELPIKVLLGLTDTLSSLKGLMIKEVAAAQANKKFEAGLRGME